MIPQNLFEYPQYIHLVRRHDPATSRMAAERTAKDLSRQESLVYAALVRAGSATSRELADLSGLPYEMIHKRMSGLRAKSKAAATGIVRDGQQEWKALI
jgi:hypothetical protein